MSGDPKTYPPFSKDGFSVEEHFLRVVGGEKSRAGTNAQISIPTKASVGEVYALANTRRQKISVK